MRYLFLLLAFCSCSPLYVLEAGWEEAKILWAKEPITELLEEEDFPTEEKQKLLLAIEARDFAETLGLKPGGSFTEYVDIERDVLVWVLSASKKDRLEPYTWWFPIVGHIPYKGFFDKEDAIDAAKELKEDGLDIYVRGSVAFSTLGWFNDPLLSTLTAFPDHLLVNIVIHEIVHNTFWIPGSVPFNESMANFIGARAAEQFFIEKEGPNSENAIAARNDWQDELVYAKFLSTAIKRLEELYERGGDSVLEEREILFESFVEEWTLEREKLKGKNRYRAAKQLNNALILSQRVYLDRLWVFEEGLEYCGHEIKCAIEVLKQVDKEAPFESYLSLSKAKNSASEDPADL